ncbi:MAG: hypothetical protein AB7O97_13455 [Planctomycetota bacterium]
MRDDQGADGATPRADGDSPREVWRPGARSMPDELERLVYLAAFVAAPLLVPWIGLVLLQERAASAVEGALGALALSLPPTAIWVAVARWRRWYRRSLSVALLAAARWLVGAGVPFAEVWWEQGLAAVVALGPLLLAAAAFAWLRDDR